MSANDPAAKALEQLNTLFSEVHYRMHFTAYTGTLTGSAISITVSDAGPKNPRARYSAKAETEDGRCGRGNPSDTISGALENVHWRDIGLRWNGDDLEEVEED